MIFESADWNADPTHTREFADIFGIWDLINESKEKSSRSKLKPLEAAILTTFLATPTTNWGKSSRKNCNSETRLGIKTNKTDKITSRINNNITKAE